MDPILRLGVLTWRKGNKLEEERFLNDLAKQAEKLNTQIFIFSPTDVLANGSIRSLHFKHGVFKEVIVPPPDVIYDRFRNMSPQAFRPFVQFHTKTKIPLLSSRLAHKWNLHLYLSTNPQISNWLPHTLFYSTIEDVTQLLKSHSKIYLKPVNGTGGKGILTVTKQKSSFLVNGKNELRRAVAGEFCSLASLQSFLKSWTKDRKFIVQQGLNLSWVKDCVVDFRLLVQKGADGEWHVTGMVGKLGPKNSATSNYHGGGKAFEPQKFLTRFLTLEQCDRVLKECRHLGIKVAKYLEEKFGQLVELGIDIGIDRDAKVWLIEVNPKPGRQLFREVGDLATYIKAVRRPIEYALYFKNSLHTSPAY